MGEFDDDDHRAAYERAIYDFLAEQFATGEYDDDKFLFDEPAGVDASVYIDFARIVHNYDDTARPDHDDIDFEPDDHDGAEYDNNGNRVSPAGVLYLHFLALADEYESFADVPDDYEIIAADDRGWIEHPFQFPLYKSSRGACKRPRGFKLGGRWFGTGRYS